LCIRQNLRDLTLIHGMMTYASLPLGIIKMNVFDAFQHFKLVLQKA
jgi:hypothetical protein